MEKYLINQPIIDQIHDHFRKRILKDQNPKMENEYFPADQVKKIKAEISRLKIILRECRPDQSEFYQEMIDFLQSKIQRS